jgi:heptaprenyl diphosphate synthase
MGSTATTTRLGVSETEGLRLRPRDALIAGLCVIPAFVFQASLLLKWLQVLEFMILSAVAGKRVKVLPNVVMITSIVAAHLLTPVGEVLWRVAGVPVTRGALVNGLEKSALLIGMIYLSRFSIRPGVKLPGRIGSMLSLVFVYFEQTLAGERLRRGNIIEQIDERIIAVDRSVRAENEPGPDGTADRAAYAAPRDSTARGLLCVALFIAGNWALLLYSLSSELL